MRNRVDGEPTKRSRGRISKAITGESVRKLVDRDGNDDRRDPCESERRLLNE